MSPNADCPASSPTMPGTTLPSTWPQITGNGPITMVASSAIGMSQVEVPITFTRALLAGPGPRPPPCGRAKGAAGDHHLAGEVQALRPPGVRVPTGRSAVQLSVKRGSRDPPSAGDPGH